jgi:hypothetical protein
VNGAGKVGLPIYFVNLHQQVLCLSRRFQPVGVMRMYRLFGGEMDDVMAELNEALVI